ncbi:MAG: TetR family transcriptional regulator C-terminal domain-containing protein, partial [Bacteroidota bacterium]
TSAEITDEKIMGLYMKSVLENEMAPKSIYKFCKENTVKEEDFYKYFGAFDGLQKAIWSKFFKKTIDLINENEAYNNFTNKEKLLTFLFSFFEMLTLNRSYVLFALKQHRNTLENLSQLKGLRVHVKDFATELIDEANAGRTLRITKQSPMLFSEGAWIQVLFLLKFWMDDSSPGFEKTDIAIEKSVKTIFDVFDNTPLESILDFGKFLYKETFA